MTPLPPVICTAPSHVCFHLSCTLVTCLLPCVICTVPHHVCFQLLYAPVHVWVARVFCHRSSSKHANNLGGNCTCVRPHSREGKRDRRRERETAKESELKQPRQHKNKAAMKQETSGAGQSAANLGRE
ncbi:unnamed protein product, partial [Ectocarpus sp. 8 AP-2014]